MGDGIEKLRFLLGDISDDGGRRARRDEKRAEEVVFHGMIDGYGKLFAKRKGRINFELFSRLTKMKNYYQNRVVT